MIMARGNSINFSLLRLYLITWRATESKLRHIPSPSVANPLCAVTLGSSVLEDAHVHTPHGKLLWKEILNFPYPIFQNKCDLFSLGFPNTYYPYDTISSNRPHIYKEIYSWQDAFLNVLIWMYLFLLHIFYQRILCFVIKVKIPNNSV